MPEYHAVQTYQQLTNHDLRGVVEKCSHALSDLDWLNSTTRQWLNSLVWHDGDGFGWFIDCPTLQLQIHKRVYSVRLMMLGWTSQVIPGLDHDWLEFEILFHSEELDDYSMFPIPRYKPSVGTDLWYVMKTISPHFPDFGVFLTDESQDSHAWIGYFQNNQPNRWEFELGLVHPEAQSGFLPVPETHFSREADNQLWLARKYVWEIPPWD